MTRLIFPLISAAHESLFTSLFWRVCCLNTARVADLCVRSVPCISNPEAVRGEEVDVFVEGGEERDDGDGEVGGDMVELNMYP